MDWLKSNAIKIAVVVALLAVGNTVYQSCGSDKARAIKALEKIIKEKEKQVDELTQKYDELTKREKVSLQKIAELKVKLKDVQDLISESEVDIDEIKNQMPNITGDLDFLEDFTRGTLDSLDSGRGVLGRVGSGPGK